MEYEPKNLRDKESWDKQVAMNTDPYGKAAIDAAAHVMCLLDQGKTPKEAEDGGFKGKGLTGFMAGAAASIISKVHERGDEFRDYWNGQFGVSPGEKGTVNPAVLTMKTA